MHIADLIERIKLPFRKDRELYSSFYKMLGFYPRDIRLYIFALHHRSQAIRDEGHVINNERLEFLGDAVLDSVVGDIVFRHFRNKSEGFLTNTRSKIVQRETLNRIAVEIGLDKLIVSSNHSQTHNSYMNGNTFEALVGAIYLDRGYGCCMKFIRERIIGRYIDLDKVAKAEVNFKSKLIEWGQKRHADIQFEIIDEKKEGGNSPVFVSQVRIDGVACGVGRGYSKKESQQIAAKRALEKLKSSGKLRKEVLGMRKTGD